MYFDGGQWILAATLLGMGFDCGMDKLKQFEDSDNGIWNKVNVHYDFITKTMKKYDQMICERRHF